MRIRRVLLALVVAAVTLAAFQWTNQKKDKPRDTTIRNVSGIVQLPDDTPAQGAVVQLKNMKSLQVRSFITQDGGKYIFQNLSTSADYELKAEFKGMASGRRTLSIYDTRPDAIVNLKLEPGRKETAREEEKK